MAKIVAIVQARMGSTRLPKKSLADVAGKPMLQHVLERIGRAHRIEEVVVATSIHPRDRPILQLAQRLGVRAAAGREDDVLSRFLLAARAAKADIVVRITGDCPLIDPELSDEVVEAFQREQVDYAANCIRETYPRGLDTEVFSADSLAQAARLATHPYEREHVTPYFYQRPDQFKLFFMEATGELRRPELRLCVDAEEDLQLVREIYARLGGGSNTFSSRDVIRLMDQEPWLAAINAHVSQKELGE